MPVRRGPTSDPLPTFPAYILGTRQSLPAVIHAHEDLSPEAVP